MWPRTISRSASHRTPKEKGRAQCRVRSREKAVNTAIKNPASDRSTPWTMLSSFYNYFQPLQVWADRTSLNSKKWNWHVDTRKGVNASIKGKENQRRGGRKLLGQGLENGNHSLWPPEEDLVKFVRIHLHVNFHRHHGWPWLNRCPVTKA